METTKNFKIVDCKICGAQFSTYEGNQTMCPTCIGKNKKNKASKNVTISRECRVEMIVKNTLPESRFSWWRTGEYKDMAALRWTAKGKDFGWGAPYAEWNGRMDVWVNFRTSNGQETFVDRADRKYPSVVRFRLMEVRKAAKSSSPAFVVDGLNGQETRPKIEYSDTWQYVALDPLPDETLPELIQGELGFKTVSRKTTLKGLGAQWEEGIDPENTVWHVRMSGSCRSGRYGSESVLYIASHESPLYWTDREGERVRIPEEKSYEENN